MKMKKIILGIFLCYMINGLSAQSFHEEVQSTFNFSPRKLSKKEHLKIIPKLDKFFEKIISNKSKYLQPLRNELKGNYNTPYFYFDGGILLMEISKEPADIQLVADALVKTDLKDLPPEMYLNHLLRLSIKGANVIDAAFHIYSDSEFKVFIVEHSLFLNQGECLEFILPRYNSELYVNKLINIYSHTDTVSKKMSIIPLLYYSRNCKADEFLTKILSDKNESKNIKLTVHKILELTPNKRRQNREKYQKIRNEIKSVLTRISDEAIYELDELTLKMGKYYKCKQ